MLEDNAFIASLPGLSLDRKRCLLVLDDQQLRHATACGAAIPVKS